MAVNGKPLNWPMITNIGMVLIVSIVSGWLTTINVSVQEKFAALEKRSDKLDFELTRRAERLEGDLTAIRVELRERYQLFPTQFEYKAFEKRIDQALNDLHLALQERMTRKEFEAWKQERDRRIEILEKSK